MQIKSPPFTVVVAGWTHMMGTTQYQRYQSNTVSRTSRREQYQKVSNIVARLAGAKRDIEDKTMASIDVVKMKLHEAGDEFGMYVGKSRVLQLD